MSRADGSYSFDIPLDYGLNTIFIESITKEGEAVQRVKRIQIPHDSMRKGSLLYEFQMGRTNHQSWTNGKDDWMLHLSAKGGITNRQTLESGVDWKGNFVKPDWFWLEWTNRLQKQQFISVEWIQGHRIRTDWRGTLQKGVTASSSYTRYFRRSAINRTDTKQMAEVQWNHSLSAGIVPMVIQAGMDLRETNRLWSSGFRASLLLYIDRFQWGGSFLRRLECRNRTCLKQQTSWRITARYRLPEHPSLPTSVRSWNIRSSLSGGGKQLPLRGFDLRATRQTRRAGINVGWSYYFLTDESVFHIGIQMKFANAFSSKSNHQIRNEGLQSGLALYGSLGFDSSSGRFISRPESSVGYASLAILLFQDVNANGTYEMNEDIILPYSAVRISNQPDPELGKDGILRYSRLPGHTLLEVEVISSNIPDPLLIPIQNTFKHTTRINRFQELQIPFYYGGWVEGRVLMEELSKQEVIPVSGLTLRIWRPEFPDKIRTVSTFRDGTFYADGLLPGIYHIRPDIEDMEMLHLASSEPWLEFMISGNPSDPKPTPIRMVLTKHNTEQYEESPSN